MIKKLLQKNSQFSVVSVAFVCSLLIVACNKKQEITPVVAPPASAKAKAAVQTKPVLQQVSSSLRLPPPPVNQFDFSNKKDPFKPFIVLKAEPKNTPDLQKKTLRSSLPIHSFDVSQFKLIGMVTGGRENKAMVTDPGGKGYVLKVGMLIGKNDGKVVSINSSGVDILEQFKDDNGRVRKENIKLTLPRKQ